MRRTLTCYFKLLSIQLRSQMQFRVSFWLDVLTTILLNGSYFFSVYLVLQRFETIAGWNLGEIAFLIGLIETSFGTMDMIFSGFDDANFAQFILRGTLDQMLLRPVNVTVQVLGSKFLLRRLGRITEGVIIFCISLSLLHVHWTLGKLLFLPVVFVSQVIAMGALFIMGSVLTIWTLQPVEAVNILTYGGNELMSYPMTVYPRLMRDFFTYVMPFIFLNYYPALFFLDKPDPLGLPVFAPFLAPLVAAGMMAAALWLWAFGLRHYQGAGT